VPRNDDDAPDPARILKLAKQALSSAELRKKYNVLDFWGPNQFYPSQMKFFESGATVHQRLVYGGNQTGKTWAAACETAWHMSGCYPNWWRGRRFRHPVRVWIIGPTGQLVRDGVQRKLCSLGGEFGTGAIPLTALATPGKRPIMVPGGGGIDTFYVTHRTDGVVDGVSEGTFKSYEMRREKLQTESVHVVWADEQPSEELYSELYARTSAVDGVVYVSYTPILGAGALTHRFLKEPSADRTEIRIPAEEAKHITPERRAELEAGYQEYEKETRIHGIPAMGRGRVFPFPVEDLVKPITWDNDSIIKSWSRWIVGVDFGYNHNFAAALCAWAHDTGEFVVVDSFTMARSSAVHHVQRIASMCKGYRIPISWPADGLQHERGSGSQIMAVYKSYGAPMLATHAENKGGGNKLEPAIAAMYEDMVTGKFTIASHNQELIEEYLSYHRDDDLKIAAIRDDALSAVRYAHMMRRSGKPLSECEQFNIGNGLYNGRPSLDRSPQFARGTPNHPDGDFDPFTGR
jgi:phage terminase large subunit-like protein